MRNEPRRSVDEAIEPSLVRRFSTEYESKRRVAEREALGEDIGFGAGYPTCISEYFELPGKTIGNRPANRFLERVAGHLDIPEDLLVPLLPGSLGAEGYLRGTVDERRIERMLPLGGLEVAVMSDVRAALDFRLQAPILFPLELTRGSLDAPLEARSCLREARELAASMSGVPEREIAMQLGGDEVIKAVFRMIAADFGPSRPPSVFLSFPEYFDAFSFAGRLGLRVVSSPAPHGADEILDWAEAIHRARPEAIYLSNPRNPLGRVLDERQIAVLLEAAPEDSVLLMDEVNVWLGESGRSPLRVLQGWFPKRRIIAARSLSKSYDLVTARFGFAVAGPEDIARLRKWELPSYPGATLERVKASLRLPVDQWTIEHAKLFLHRLHEIASNSAGEVWLLPSESNFCVIEFSKHEVLQRFLASLQAVDLTGLGIKKVLGAPRVGKGLLQTEDFLADGSLDMLRIKDRNEAGMLGLSENCVRLSALSHHFVLDVLERTLR